MAGSPSRALDALASRVTCHGLVLMFLVLAVTVDATQCRLRTPGADYDATSNTGARERTFVVNFNTTLQQPNVVAYVSTGGGGKCDGCQAGESCKGSTFETVSYSTMTNDDYTNTGYSRGHLVPRADYGCTTMIISNVVPMLQTFNGGTWDKTENEIRKNHAGSLVVKGCEYALNKYVVTKTGKWLYIPLGCYYVVFAETTLSAYWTNVGLTLVDYEYCTHETNSRCSHRLPYWLDCGASTPEVPDEGLSPAEEAVISLVVLIVLAVGAAATYIWRQKCFDRLRGPKKTADAGVELVDGPTEPGTRSGSEQATPLLTGLDASEEDGAV